LKVEPTFNFRIVKALEIRVDFQVSGFTLPQAVRKGLTQEIKKYSLAEAE
jgi:hypothetical protein